jgi:CheY-like chemotaxis protein
VYCESIYLARALRCSPSHSRTDHSMRILIIDDDDIARELLSSTLKQSGHEVFELATAIGATRSIFEHDIEAVVVDVNLPDISGDKLARVLRQNSRGSKLGIVLVSSRPIEELRALAKVCQADAVVSKSDIRSRLETAVQQACQRRIRVVRFG